MFLGHASQVCLLPLMQHFVTQRYEADMISSVTKNWFLSLAIFGT